MSTAPQKSTIKRSTENIITNILCNYVLCDVNKFDQYYASNVDNTRPPPQLINIFSLLCGIENIVMYFYKMLCSINSSPASNLLYRFYTCVGVWCVCICSWARVYVNLFYSKPLFWCKYVPKNSITTIWGLSLSLYTELQTHMYSSIKRRFTKSRVGHRIYRAAIRISRLVSSVAQSIQKIARSIVHMWYLEARLVSIWILGLAAQLKASYTPCRILYISSICIWEPAEK